MDFHGVKASYYTFSSKLSTISSIGYYRGGPEIGIKACLHGFTDDVNRFYEGVEKLKSELFNKAFKIAYASMKKSKYTQWFNVGNLFYNIGSKSIGLFCSQIVHRRIIDGRKYLFGLMNLNPMIPNLGRLQGSYVKISGRVPKILSNEIARGEMPAINVVMVQASTKLKGFADGHSVAASGVVPKGLEYRFINEVDSFIEEWKVKHY